MRKPSIELRPGDLIVAYTDGVTEALNPEGEEFGEERLKELLGAAIGRPRRECRRNLAERCATGSAGPSSMTI